ncbi:hypothetical protein V8E36_004626 [Tilletia maclaganii]
MDSASPFNSYPLARRADPIDFNATNTFPVFAKLNDSSRALLQSEADRLATPDQLDGFSVSILVALYGTYVLFLLGIGFMRTFLRSRYYALPTQTQRQCAGLLASALLMSAQPPLLGYALSAAKWDLNISQLRLARLSAIMICAFSLFDLIHRDRQSFLIFVKRSITLAAVSFQFVMMDRVHDPSFIITLVALLFVAFTEPPVFFGLFLYKIRCPVKWTKFVLRSAVGQTIFVKGLGAAVGVYTWVKFQRQNSSTLGKANSAAYLASLIVLLTCQILIVIPVHKLAKEVDERYAKKEPLDFNAVNTKKGGRKRGQRRRSAMFSNKGDGPVHAVHGRMQRFNNDRMSTFNMNTLHRDSLEMDEKHRHSDDDLEAASSYKSMTPTAPAEKQGFSANIREQLRSFSPLGRRSTNFSRPTKSPKREQDHQFRQASSSTNAASSSGSKKYADATADGARSEYDERGVPILSFHTGGDTMKQSGTAATNDTYYNASNSGRTSATPSYTSPRQIQQHLEDVTSSPKKASNGLRSETQQPQIIISSASSSAHAGRESETSSTLQDYRYSSNAPSYAEDGWNRSVSGSTMANPYSPSFNATGSGSRNSPAGGGLAGGMSTIDETSRYALGIVQEYLEPAESPQSGTEWASAASPGLMGMGEQDVRPFSTEPLRTPQLQEQQLQQHSYTVPQNGSRPRQAFGNTQQQQQYSYGQTPSPQQSPQARSYGSNGGRSYFGSQPTRQDRSYGGGYTSASQPIPQQSRFDDSGYGGREQQHQDGDTSLAYAQPSYRQDYAYDMHRTRTSSAPQQPPFLADL